MNNITVFDILNLPIMANATLKAGEGGLQKQVSYVNVLDNYYDASKPEETPKNFGKNFYLTSMYYGLNDPEYICTLLLHFIDMDVSAVCIIDEYMSELPSEAYKIANEHNLPIIFISNNTPYALIISSIMELKLSYQDAERSENLIHELVNPDCTEDRKKSIIYDLNPNLLGKVVAFYCLCPKGQSESDSNPGYIHFLQVSKADKSSFSCEYKNGILFIKSFMGKSEKQITTIISDTLSEMNTIFPNYNIGISNVLPLMEINDAISQCCIASASGVQTGSNHIFFRDIGISELLFKLISNKDLNTYFDNIYNPIMEYDLKFQGELYTTLEAYVECNMDYVKTSSMLHVHQNTVRYRLKKIKELIPYGKSSLDFNQTIYIIYKIKKIKDYI